MTEKRESTGFMIKQRAYLKLFILTKIGTERVYAHQIFEDLKADFKEFGFKPYHSEVYRSLQELLEDGYVKRQRKKLKTDSYQEVFLYYINDPDKVRAYKKLVKQDIERCKGLLEYAIKSNFS